MPQVSWFITSLLYVDVFPQGVPSSVKFVGVEHVGSVCMSEAVSGNNLFVLFGLTSGTCCIEQIYCCFPS